MPFGVRNWRRRRWRCLRWRGIRGEPNTSRPFPQVSIRRSRGPGPPSSCRAIPRVQPREAASGPRGCVIRTVAPLPCQRDARGGGGSGLLAAPAVTATRSPARRLGPLGVCFRSLPLPLAEAAGVRVGKGEPRDSSSSPIPPPLPLTHSHALSRRLPHARAPPALSLRVGRRRPGPSEPPCPLPPPPVPLRPLIPRRRGCGAAPRAPRPLPPPPAAGTVRAAAAWVAPRLREPAGCCSPSAPPCPTSSCGAASTVPRAHPPPPPPPPRWAISRGRRGPGPQPTQPDAAASRGPDRAGAAGQGPP